MGLRLAMERHCPQRQQGGPTGGTYRPLAVRRLPLWGTELWFGC